MSVWWMSALGLDLHASGQIEQVHWFWARPGFAWAALLLCIPLSWLIHRRHRAGMPLVNVWPLRVLTFCRVAVVVLLLLVLAGPFARITFSERNLPVLAVIVDRSASMDVGAGPFADDEIAAMAYAAGMLDTWPAEGRIELKPEQRDELNVLTRAQLVQAVAAKHGEAFLRASRNRFDLRIYNVASDVTQDHDALPDSTIAKMNERHATNLGLALDRIVTDAAGRTLAGVIMISDGRNTSGADPLQVVRTPSFTAMAAPIYVLPPGSRNPFADIALVHLVVPDRVGAGDSVALRATIESHGFDQREVSVALRRGDETIDAIPLTLRDGRQQQVTLTFEASNDGIQALEVVVEAQPEERIGQNNRQTVRIDVDARPLKILFIEGYPRWDFRFLDHMLRRDRGLDVTLIMESALRGEGIAEAKLSAHPDLPQDVAAFAAYDLVVLGDISLHLLPPRLQQQLVEAVSDQGVGLIVQAGFKHMPHTFARDDSPLSAALPMTFDAAPGRDAPPYAPFTMRLTAAGALHPGFQVHTSPEQNRTLWNAMPRFFWAAAPRQSRPGATVLAEIEAGSERIPMIAEHLYGRGRVLFIGTDSTFLWRRNTGNALFDRFWSQSMRHIARNAERADDQNWLDIQPRNIELGDQATLELFTIDAEGKPVEAQTPQVEIQNEAERVSLPLNASHAAGHYRATWRPDRVGIHTVRYTDATGSTITGSLHVAPSRREWTRPTIDFHGLSELANATGGQVLDLAQLPALPGRLADPVEPTTRMAERDLWDNWLTVMLLVGLYCLDVGMRRMMGNP